MGAQYIFSAGVQNILNFSREGCESHVKDDIEHISNTNIKYCPTISTKFKGIYDILIGVTSNPSIQT